MPPFRFLDLAPEMRNAIYEEALTHDRLSGRIANVALLAVCKQVHEEAKGIFKELSTFGIKAEGIRCFDPSRCDLKLEGDVDMSFEAWKTEALEFYDILSRHVHKTPTVKLHIRVFGRRAGEEAKFCWEAQVNKFLYALVNLLNGSEGLRKVIIEFDQEEVRLDDNSLDDSFWPWRLLPSAVEVEFTGLDDQHMKEIQPNIDRRISREREPSDLLNLVGYLMRRLNDMVPEDDDEAHAVQVCLEALGSNLVRDGGLLVRTRHHDRLVIFEYVCLAFVAFVAAESSVEDRVDAKWMLRMGYRKAKKFHGVKWADEMIRGNMGVVGRLIGMEDDDWASKDV